MDQANALLQSFMGAMRPSPSSVKWVLDRISMAELLKPGEPLDANTKAFMAALWLKTLAEIGEDSFQTAFVRVIENSTFRPDIAEIRKAAGINPDREALKELKFLIGAMRVHTPRLVTIYAEKGNPQSAKVPPPPLGEKTEAALRELGMGSREEGLRVIAGHPAISKDVDEKYRVKNAMEIEKRWVEAWR